VKTALIIGATGGMGKAIAQKLIQQGMKVYGVGRRNDFPAGCVGIQIDITSDAGRESLFQVLAKEEKLDVLIHSAGILLESHDIEDLDIQYNTNFRAPYIITRKFFPLLSSAKGQVVFINSMAGLAIHRSELEQYAITKYALRAFADSFRIEANAKGIRVLSLYPGRVATPMLESLYEQEGRLYEPNLLLQPEDVVATIAFVLALPPTAEVTELTIRAMTSEVKRRS
jgi:NAD(P)-dependent dehydrogenase (short-subunit alcohol dehydrogenase family)